MSVSNTSVMLNRYGTLISVLCLWYLVNDKMHDLVTCL